jgi:hypothetical protein
MGQMRTFRCTSCDHSAEVSGGNDAGMSATTTTILCEDCHLLMDVVTGRLSDGFQPIALRGDAREALRVVNEALPRQILRLERRPYTLTDRAAQQRTAPDAGPVARAPQPARVSANVSRM